MKRLEKKYKKPTVWGIAVLSVLLAIGLIIVVLTSGRSYVFAQDWAAKLSDPELELSDGAPFTAEIVKREESRVVVRVRADKEIKDPGSHQIYFRSPETKQSLVEIARYLYIYDNGFILDENTGHFPGSNAVFFLLAAYFTGCAVILFRTFRKQLRHSMYSYNTIIYIGFGLFVLALALLFCSYSVQLLRDPFGANMYSMYHTLKNSATSYLIYSIPFITALALGLIFSNIELLRHESRNIAHILAAGLGVVLIIGEIVLVILERKIDTGNVSVLNQGILSVVSAVFLYFECMLIGTIIAVTFTGKHTPSGERDHLIVLGCGMRKDGTPTPLLAGRCDAAAAFYNRQTGSGGKRPKIVCSGGQGGNEPISEAACMRNYLIGKGIPAEDILLEDRSRNTFENFRFSGEVIAETCSDAAPVSRPAFFTTSYHVFRSGIWARRAGMPRSIEGGGAKTKWYFWPNAFVKEFLGLLERHRRKQLLLLGSIIVLYILFAVFLPK